MNVYIILCFCGLSIASIIFCILFCIFFAVFCGFYRYFVLLFKLFIGFLLGVLPKNGDSCHFCVFFYCVHLSTAGNIAECTKERRKLWIPSRTNSDLSGCCPKLKIENGEWKMKSQFVEVFQISYCRGRRLRRPAKAVAEGGPSRGPAPTF